MRRVFESRTRTKIRRRPSCDHAPCSMFYGNNNTVSKPWRPHGTTTIISQHHTVLRTTGSRKTHRWFQQVVLKSILEILPALRKWYLIKSALKDKSISNARRKLFKYFLTHNMRSCREEHFANVFEFRNTRLNT